MGLNSISGLSTNNGYAYNKDSKVKNEKDAENSKSSSEGVVYEKNTQTKTATYSINKMSSQEREALVQQLKQDQVTRKQNLTNIVQQLISKQAKSFSITNDEDAMWKFLASGNYTVDAQTKLQAQKDIAEDGYYGVAQTSQRLFDFASALAGDDVEKMKEMQEAMQKGFKEATKSWGKELPDICKNTIDAANKLFDDYYASKGNE